MDIKNNITIFNREVTTLGGRLIAVGKTHPAETLRVAYDAGQRIFGENKVQEMTAKYEVLPKDIDWHMIGHLQTNKVKLIVPFVSLIHSIDSVKLMEELHKQAAKTNRTVACLLQVHIAQEETKFGFNDAELFSVLESPSTRELTSIRIEGLMGMASLTASQDQIRKEFRHLKTLFQTLQSRSLPPNVHMKELSMGMSSDYKIALEEGSTLVRIGTAIFGDRKNIHP